MTHEKIPPSWFARLCCFLGVLHGPNWLGHRPTTRSSMTAPFERTCGHCGTRWHGRQVETPRVRTIGDWRKVR